MDTLTEKNQKRSRFLHYLYEKTNGDDHVPVRFRSLSDELGFSPEETGQIRQYLYGEGLIKDAGQGHISITHQGIRKVEAEQLNSQQPTRHLIQAEQGVTVADPRKVFVVYGRNKKAQKALFDFLRAIGLAPIEWAQAVAATGKASPYIGEILDAGLSLAQAVVVLMTPDDEARLREPFRESVDPSYETELTPQARPNVIFEAGMAMGRFPKRTVLVQLGNLRPFSDISGLHILRLGTTSEKRQELASRLETAGCLVDRSGTDWLSTGDFTIDDEPQKNPAELPPNRTLETEVSTQYLTMKQNILYEPIKRWLEDKGFKTFITGKETTLVIPISDLVPMAYKVPDLIGVNHNRRVAIVEVEKDKKQFFDAFGRCLLWRCIATRAYLAYPKGKIARAPLLKKLGVGLLEVDTDSQTVNEIIALPQNDAEMFDVLELHPTDFKKEMELAEHIQKSLG